MITIIRLDHPRLVKMIEAFQGEREIVVVMEHLAGDHADDHDGHYANDGDLDDFDCDIGFALGCTLKHSMLKLSCISTI